MWFSESGIESLVRSGGWRRLQRFAGSTGASNVAFRGITPDPATAFRAVAGSGDDAGQVGGSLNQQSPTSSTSTAQPGQPTVCFDRPSDQAEDEK